MNEQVKDISQALKSLTLEMASMREAMNGADAFFAIHSIADTAWKNNQSQLNAISTILSL